jgi:hypothetical protein
MLFIGEWWFFDNSVVLEALIHFCDGHLVIIGFLPFIKVFISEICKLFVILH